MPICKGVGVGGFWCVRGGGGGSIFRLDFQARFSGSIFRLDFQARFSGSIFKLI